MHVGGWGHKYYSSRSTDLGIKVRIKIKENFKKKFDHLIRAVLCSIFLYTNEKYFVYQA